jgi:hypothetical protein
MLANASAPWSMIALRMLKACRSSLARAPARILKKKKELTLLKAQAVAAKAFDSITMTMDDRRRMYQLEDELSKSARDLISKKMLLRPNTTFAVTWKLVFVACILLEILQLVFKPKLEQVKDPKTGAPLDIVKLLEYYLVPGPVSEWKGCLGSLSNDYRNESIVNGPWYCRQSLETVQAVYATLLRLVLHKGAVIVGIVCLMDVFVTFFTGELHPETGILLPKSFGKRWLLPGLLLQLLVNPQMGAISNLVKQMRKAAMALGPVRVWRWAAAFAYPLLRITFTAVQWYVWHPLVSHENKSLQQQKLRRQQSGDPECGRRRRSSLQRNAISEINSCCWLGP